MFIRYFLSVRNFAKKFISSSCGSLLGVEFFIKFLCRFKACVHYFLSIFFLTKWWPFKNYVQYFLLYLKSSSCSQDFYIFVLTPLFPPVSHCFRRWSKINLKVYYVINCLNKNLVTHFVWHLEKEKRHNIETLSIARVLNNEHLCGKVMQKMFTKS